MKLSSELLSCAVARDTRSALSSKKKLISLDFSGTLVSICVAQLVSERGFGGGQVR